MHIDPNARPMLASLTIRKLEPQVKEQLRLRAARHGHSMEEEARRILRDVLAVRLEPENAFDRLRRHFVGLDDVELELPAREAGREPPSFT